MGSGLHQSVRQSWGAFIKAAWRERAAADFFTTEVWTPRGLTTFYTLFVFDLASRRVHIARTTVALGEAFMGQMARNLTEVIDGFLLRHRKLIGDRDSNFSTSFCQKLARAGGEAVRIPPNAPNCNAYAERFVRSIKEECLRKMIFFGEDSLRRAIKEYVAHYNQGRPHQGIGNGPIERVVGPRSDFAGRRGCGRATRWPPEVLQGLGRVMGCYGPPSIGLRSTASQSQQPSPV